MRCGGDLVRRVRQAAEETGEDEGPADIILTQADFLASLGKEGLLLNLPPSIHETGDLTPEALFPELIEPLRVGDQVFVLPVSVALVMPFYSADMFAQKDVTPPTAERTRDHLLEAAVRLAETNATHRSMVSP